MVLGRLVSDPAKPTVCFYGRWWSKKGGKWCALHHTSLCSLCFADSLALHPAPASHRRPPRTNTHPRRPLRRAACHGGHLEVRPL